MACLNKHGIPAGALTDQVLAQLKVYFLDPLTLGSLVCHELEVRRAQPDALEIERRELTSRINRLDQEIARYVEAVGAGTGTPAALVQAISARETERRALQAKHDHLTGVAVESADFDLSAWLEETKELLDDIRQTLEAAPAAWRQMLRRLLHEPIVVTPTPEGFAFSRMPSFAHIPLDGPAPDLIISQRYAMKNQPLTGRIDRRVQKWCPRGDASAPHGLTVPLFGRVRARAAA